MEHTNKKLKDFICIAPFQDFMVLHDSTNVCCPEWFDLEQMQLEYPEEFAKYPGSPPFPGYVTAIEDRNNLLANWNNKFHKDLRKSVLDGDYRFCTKMCPHINEVYKKNKPAGSIQEKELVKQWKINLKNPFPKRIYFNFDKSCNLKCPSCRVELISNKNNSVAEMTLESIDKQFGDTVQEIIITGSGDPFYSNIFRNWLQNFDKTKYPKLEKIYLVSNGNMFTPKMWESMSKAHNLIREMEWSIDAGTKNTYENITRLNGKWDKLMENMDYLASLNHFDNLLFSFVVQKQNYTEMKTFVNLINNKFKRSRSKAKVLFRAIQNWGHQSDSWFKDKNICDPQHPDHSLLLEELPKVLDHGLVSSNLRHLIKTPYKQLVI